MIVRAEKIITKFFDGVKDPETHKYPSVEFEEDIESGVGTWKGLKVIPLVKTTGLWFAGKSYGMSFQVIQMLIFFRSEFIGCAIDIDDENEVQVGPGGEDGADDQPLISDDESSEPNKKKQKTHEGVVDSSSTSGVLGSGVEVGA